MGWATSVLLLGLLSVGSIRTWRETARGFDQHMETKFGRVAVDGTMIPTMLRTMVAVLQESGARELYVHNFPQAYLYLDVDNPTPFQIINNANPLEDDQRIIEILEDREVGIVAIPGGFLAPRLALRDYLRERYSPVDLPENGKTMTILRRNVL